MSKFCVHCGTESADNAGFCGQCGTRFPPKKTLGETPKAAVSMTKQEYFANHCSAKAKQNNKVINILSIISLSLQGLLAVLAMINLTAARNVLKNSNLYGNLDNALNSLLWWLLLAGFGSFAFTIMGTRKSRTGFLIAATAFAIITTALGAGLSVASLDLRRLLILGIPVIYVVMIVLNYQNNKEYIASLNAHIQ